MAVKPLTQPLYWATDPVYSTGPFVGQPQKITPPLGFAAEGHRPGANFPTPAEYENDQQYNLTGLARWVFAGSAAGAADAHVLETNSSGATQVQAATVQPSGAFAQALRVSAPAGTGYAIRATGSSADATIRAETSGSAPAVEAVSTVAAGSCVRATASGTSDAIVVAQTGTGIGLTINGLGGSGHGASINYAGSGRALQIAGGTGDTAIVVAAGSNQNAITATSGANAGAAIAAVGAGTAIGVDAFGGNGSGSADGVRGTAVNANAAGVHGRSASGAGGGAGVQGDGLGAGQIGVFGTATAGYAFLFQGDSTPPLYAIGRFVPQSVDPTASTSTGDFTISLQNQFRYCVAGFGYKPFMSMPTTGSAVYGIGTQAFGAIQVVSNVFVTITTAQCLAAQGNGFASVSAGNTVRVRFTCDARVTAAAADTINLRFVDATGGGAVTICTWSGAGSGATSGFYLGVANNGWQRTIVAEVQYTPLADGDLIIRAEMQRVTSDFQVRNGRVEIIGSF